LATSYSTPVQPSHVMHVNRVMKVSTMLPNDVSPQLRSSLNDDAAITYSFLKRGRPVSRS
jgi:hypothetical protein